MKILKIKEIPKKKHENRKFGVEITNFDILKYQNSSLNQNLDVNKKNNKK